MLSGKIATLLIIATLLSLVSALFVASRYRAVMKRLMKMPLDPPLSTADAQPPGFPRPWTFRHLPSVWMTIIMPIAT